MQLGTAGNYKRVYGTNVKGYRFVNRQSLKLKRFRAMVGAGLGATTLKHFGFYEFYYRAG